MNRPLVTFALFTYNQERFIREAVRAALAQTYSPLQIVISDDCSRDRTFEVAREEVEGYGGPHSILLNRNERNLGMGGHISRVMELAEGALVVAAAGDDVSLPTRTEEFVRAWSGGGIFAVYSNYTIVDEKGKELGYEEGVAVEATRSWQDRVRTGVMRGLGCAHAWDRAVFDTFGPLPDEVVQEDVVIPFRAALLGRLAYIDQRLVRYRRHGLNVWKRRDDLLKMGLQQFAKHQGATARMMRINWESCLRDLDRLATTRPGTKSELRWATDIVRARIEFYRFKELALEDRKTGGVVSSLRAAYRVRKLGPKAVAQTLLLGLSPGIYCRMHRRQLHRRSRASEPG